MAIDICPGENATECLLRALLKAQFAAQNEINWNPISLGFTAVIGVSAILTVVQCVLAAGSRSLKAGESAIGWYSRFSASSFSMNEMRVRSVAYTPILQTNVLQMYNLKLHLLSSRIRKGLWILKSWATDDTSREAGPRYQTTSCYSMMSEGQPRGQHTL